MSKAAPRIFKLTYRAAIGRKRKVSVWIKVPYAGLFNLLDVLGRAVATRQMMWFRLDVPSVITAEMRQSLVRWPVALNGSSQLTGVDWNV